MFVGGREDEKYKMSRLTFNPKGFKIELKKKHSHFNKPTYIWTCYILVHALFISFAIILRNNSQK